MHLILRQIILFTLCILSWRMHAQVAESVLQRAEDVTVSRYVPDDQYLEVVMGSKFGKDDLRALPVTTQRIARIDLVYTAYSEDPNFDQRDLDLRRLTQLLDINPHLGVNELFQWRYVKQTGCRSSAECGDYFHGFVIYYDRLFTSEDTKVEIDSIDLELAELEDQIVEYESLVKITEREVPCEYPTTLTSMEHISAQLKKFYSCTEKFSGQVFFNAQLDSKGRPSDIKIKGRRFPCQNELTAILRHILRWRTGIQVDNEGFPVTVHGSITFPIRPESFSFYRFDPAQELVERFQIEKDGDGCLAATMDTSYVDIFPYIKKTEVSTVLERNEWLAEVFVVDVTASMFPYSADLLKWMKMLPSREPMTFVFFNDGDDKPTSAKRLGNAGGVESVTTKDYRRAQETMYEVMRRGGGGDTPENNIEALLAGQEAAPDATSAIMIADNSAFPRDAQLASRYTGDLKIILCGTTHGINTDYLNFAFLNRCSLHTKGSDITDLHLVQQGQVLTIEGYNYRLTPQGFRKEFIPRGG